MLGLAVARYSWASDEPLDGHEPCGPDHIVRIAYEAAGGRDPIWFDFDFPPGRGLGFSASSRAAGAVLAFLQQGHGPEEAQVHGYEVVAQLEGHGDNAAPAVFGGIHVVAGTVRHQLKADLPGQLMCWVPTTETTPTDENRARMAAMVNRSDAVFNLGRLGLLIAALYEGDASLLAQATQDRLHQPERLAAAPNSLAALEAALSAGASGAWLSGSGPTIAILAEPSKVTAIHEAMPAGGECFVADLDFDGALARP